MRTEELIFSQLMSTEEYARKVFPHIKEEYFQTIEDKNFFKIFSRYFSKHNKVPSKHAMLVEIEHLKSSVEVYNSLTQLLSKTHEFTETFDFLIDKTEAFCRDAAMYNALKECVLIADGQTNGKDKGSIPSILQDALSVCFDTSVGHAYIDEADQRYEYYHMSENRIPTGIVAFDDITKGGFPRKTLNVLLAPPHGGKSLVMVNFGVGALLAGFNVLYITMEMAEYEIGKRFDVNLMGIDFETLETLPKGVFDSKIQSISKKSRGKLVIKEFPTGAAHAGHFRSLLSELKTKQNYVPDMVIIDYMGICSSEKVKASGGANSYTIMKSVGEELRALAIEHNFACITAVQTNRSGVGNSDVDMTSTSESLGTPMIADWFAAIINTEELKNMKQLMFKQLKNRYKSLDEPSKFVVGVDTSRMTVYDLDDARPKLNNKKNQVKTEDNVPDMFHTIKPSKPSFDEFNF